MIPAPAEKTNPYDIAGLQASLNDSATRVSTIWITYLLFGLYLLVAAGTANHRQLLFEEGLKLPALGTEVPLFWFFVLSPVLFVLLHVYVLLQVLLLGRTAMAYSAAVDRNVRAPAGNAAVRQRLANTLFAQIFAGSPRERSGWLGTILQFIAWITLVGGPIVIILALQLAFLPYHNAFATWLHRLLLACELVIAFVFWPIVVHPERELSWERVRRDLNRVGSRAFRFPLFWTLGWVGVFLVARRALPAFGCVAVAFISLFILAYPGEPLINFLTFREIGAVDCDRGLLSHFDRLVLRNVNVVDPEKHKHLLAALAGPSFQKHWEGERTRSFAKRDLSCGIFDFADFRLVSFENARLAGATLENAQIDAAVFAHADLRKAKLNGASMEDVNAREANFSGATMANSQLRRALLKGVALAGADLSLSNMQGADLGPAGTEPHKRAQLQGTNLASTDLAGAILDSAQMQTATLIRTRLDGASLVGAGLLGADLEGARLQGANLSGADLTLARLDHSLLQASLLDRTKLDNAVLGETYIWQARRAQCSSAFVIAPSYDAVIAKPSLYDRKEGVGKPGLVQATPDNVESLIKEIPEGDDYHPRATLKGMLGPMDAATLEALKKGCGDNSNRRPLDGVPYAERLAETVCKEVLFRKEFAAGVIRSALNQQRNPTDYLQFRNPSEYFPKLAQLLLRCAGDRLEDVDRIELESRASQATSTGARP